MRTDDRRARYTTHSEDVKRTTEVSRGGSHTLKLPDGVSDWRPEAAGTYLMRVLPYPVTQEGNPDGVPVGRGHYRRMYGVHFDVGGSGRAVVCPKASFGKPCPICKKVAELSRDYKVNEATIKDVRAKDFTLLNIYLIGFAPERGEMVLAKPAEAQTVLVFAWNYSKFADALEKELKRADAKCINFASIDEGMVLKVRVIQETYLGKPFLTCDHVDFLPGKHLARLDDAVLDKLPALDDCLIQRPYEEIDKLFHGVDGEIEPEATPVPKGKTSGAPTQAPVEDDPWGSGDAGTSTPDPAELPGEDGEECKACSGTGKSSKGRPCKPCKGTGKITAQKEPDEPAAFEEPADDADDWGAGGGSSW